MLRGSPSERKACTTSGIPPRAVRVSSSGSGSSSKGKGEAVGEALGILRIVETTQQFSHPAGEKSENLPALPPNSRRPCFTGRPSTAPHLSLDTPPLIGGSGGEILSRISRWNLPTLHVLQSAQPDIIIFESLIRVPTLGSDHFGGQVTSMH